MTTGNTGQLSYQFTLIGIEVSPDTLQSLEAAFPLPDGRTARQGDVLGNATAHLLRNSARASGVCVVAWGRDCIGSRMFELLEALRSGAHAGQDWRTEGAASHRTRTHQLLLTAVDVGALSAEEKPRVYAEVSHERQGERWKTIQDVWGEMVTDAAAVRDQFAAFVVAAHRSDDAARELVATRADRILAIARQWTPGV